MTSLIAWIGIDSRGQTSAYLASDSRLSWGNSANWDTGGKLYASYNFPIIFGYCGDVTFPSQILPHTIEQIDSNLLFDQEDTIDNKISKIFHNIQNNFQNYPEKFNKGFEILCFLREHCGMKTKFHLFKIVWSKLSEWKVATIPLPNQSGLVDYSGSGAKSIFHWYRKWQNTEIVGTSRSVFSAFCDSIKSGEDPFTGGAPQLVGLYRSGAGRRFGVIYENKRFINGKLINQNDNINTVEWRNCLFERCDGHSMKIFNNAQRQPRPSRLATH